MANKPRQLKLGAMRYKVEFVEGFLEKSNTYGQVNFSSSAITIDSTLAPTFQRAVVLHEAMHCVQEALGVPHEERVCDGFAYQLLDLLRSNPQFVAWLTEGA